MYFFENQNISVVNIIEIGTAVHHSCFRFYNIGIDVCNIIEYGFKSQVF